MNTVSWLVMFGLFGFVLWLIRRGRSRTSILGEGRVLWVDQGRHVKAFRHPQYRIIAKGDAIQDIDGHHRRLWEYKSRRGPVFPSDEKQAMAAALAARANGWNISEIGIKTATTQKIIRLPMADHDLYRLVQSEAEIVRAAKKGKTLSASPSPGKCRACAYRKSCRFS